MLLLLRMIIRPVSVRVVVPVSAFVAPSGVQPATRRRVRSLGIVVGIVVEVARDGRALGDTQRRVLLLIHLERGGIMRSNLRLARRVGARPGPWAGVSLGGVTAEEVGVEVVELPLTLPGLGLGILAPPSAGARATPAHCCFETAFEANPFIDADEASSDWCRRRKLRIRQL